MGPSKTPPGPGNEMFDPWKSLKITPNAAPLWCARREEETYETNPMNIDDPYLFNSCFDQER